MYSRLICLEYEDREVYLDVADIRSFVLRKNRGIPMWTVSMRIVPDYSYSAAFRTEEAAKAFLFNLIGYKYGGTEKNVAKFTIESPSSTARSISNEMGTTYTVDGVLEERGSDTDSTRNVSSNTD